MKAPETIFLHGYSFDDEPCKNWNLEPLKRGLRGHQIQYAKYIRKDVLLEWAKAYKEEADASARGRTDNPSWGESVAMRALIEKIESL